jgi:adenylosuccinate lyase
MSLALLGATLEKIAVELRHLQRTEVLEAEEPFAPGQKGSSAMPHKRNPVGAENISGLARVLRANALAALENVALWHERDISHSSVERIIIPDSSILAHYMLRRLRAILQGLRLYPQRMKKNMALSHRLYCSQRVLLALTHKGLSRQEAYRLVQRNAMLCWQKGMDFLQALRKDKEVRRYLSPQELQELFSLRPYLQNIGHIYQRVFGGEQ